MPAFVPAMYRQATRRIRSAKADVHCAVEAMPQALTAMPQMAQRQHKWSRAVGFQET